MPLMLLDCNRSFGSSIFYKWQQYERQLKYRCEMCVGGCLKRNARAVQLFGRMAGVETHTLWYFEHHCCFVVGFDGLEI